MMREPVRRTVGALPAVGTSLREAILASPATQDAHEAAAEDIEALAALEVALPRSPVAPAYPLRVAAWNAERLKYHAESRALMERVGADLWLLSEVDIGMARSGNVHTLAQTLPAGTGWVFGTEFVELGLGDARETVWHRGAVNAAALHGNAIASAIALSEPAAIALDDSGRWFTGAVTKDQRRVGGRIAVAACVSVGGAPLWLVSTHLESESDPALRADQSARLLEALDCLAGEAPCIVGGDFNTKAHTAGRIDLDEIANAEPLFARFEAAGFAWRGANAPEPTQRTRPDGDPPAPFWRLDWLFLRGLAAEAARTVPAVARDGSAISDHEVVAVTVRPA